MWAVSVKGHLSILKFQKSLLSFMSRLHIIVDKLQNETKMLRIFKPIWKVVIQYT